MSTVCTANEGDGSDCFIPSPLLKSDKVMNRPSILMTGGERLSGCRLMLSKWQTWKVAGDASRMEPALATIPSRTDPSEPELITAV